MPTKASKNKKGTSVMAKKTSTKKKSQPAKLPRLAGRRLSKPFLFVMAFAVVGLVTLIASLAATPTGTIVSKHNNECLENFFNRQVNTNFISTYPCQSSNQAQKWTFASDKSIRTAQNYCLEVPSATQRSGARVWLWQCNGGENQKWEAQANSTIRHPKTGLCLEMTSSDTFLGGPNILVQNCNASNKRQQWTVPQSAIPIPVPQPAPTNPPAPTTPSGAVDVKAACRNTSSNTVNGTSVRSGFPNDANTGPEVAGVNEDKLKPSGRSGKWSITQDGYVVDKVYHNGVIEVNANNVTIKNSVICGVGTMIVRSNGQNLVIENSIIRGERGAGTINSKTGEPCAATVGYGNYTVRRSEMAGCADGVKLANRVEVHDSWFHSSYTNRFGGGAGTHNDTVQKNDNTPVTSLVFKGNAAYQDACTSNRHFQLKSKTGQSMQSLVIEDNFFYGIRVVMMDGFTTQQGGFRNNVLAGTAARGPFATGLLYAGSGLNSLTRAGNVYEAGGAANSNPGGYTCAAS